VHSYNNYRALPTYRTDNIEQEIWLPLTDRAHHHTTVFPVKYDSRNNWSHMTSDHCNWLHRFKKEKSTHFCFLA